MKTSVSIPTVDREVDLHRWIAEAGRASFDAIELTVRDDSPVSIRLNEAECRNLRARVEEAGLCVSALVLDSCEQSASGMAAVRKAVRAVMTSALDLAQRVGAHSVIVPPTFVVASAASIAATPYGQVYFLAVDALSSLRFEAQRRGIHIACTADGAALLLSPLECRRFVDEVNSPWVKISLDASSHSSFELLHDWIATLGHRLTRVGVAAPRTALATPDTMRRLGESLRSIRFTGTIACRAGDDLIEARAGLATALQLDSSSAPAR